VEKREADNRNATQGRSDAIARMGVVNTKPDRATGHKIAQTRRPQRGKRQEQAVFGSNASD